MDDVDVLRDLIDAGTDPGMNRDLAAWADEHGEKGPASQTTASTGIAQALPAANRSCHICRKPAAIVCLRCEKGACKGHHHVMYGLCTSCVAVADPEADEALLERPELDIDWVDD